jgi:hypothetical protein
VRKGRKERLREREREREYVRCCVYARDWLQTRWRIPRAPPLAFSLFLFFLFFFSFFQIDFAFSLSLSTPCAVGVSVCAWPEEENQSRSDLWRWEKEGRKPGGPKTDFYQLWPKHDTKTGTSRNGMEHRERERERERERDLSSLADLPGSILITVSITKTVRSW